MLRAFINNVENTMNSNACGSRAGFLLELSKKYLPQREKYKNDDQYQKAIENVIEMHIAAFKAFVEINKDALGIKDEEIKEIADYIEAKIKENINQLDAATAFTDQQNIQRAFPLKEVFALTFCALLDNDLYKKACGQKSDQELEQDRIHRVSTAIGAFKYLISKPHICHTGTRNEVIGALNGVYPVQIEGTEKYELVRFVEDIDSFLKDVAFQTLKKALLAHYNPQQQYSIIRGWIEDTKTVFSDIFARFLERHKQEVKAQLVIALTKKFLNPSDKDTAAKLNAVLNELNLLDPPLDIPQVRIMHIILTSKPDGNDAKTGAFLRTREILKERIGDFFAATPTSHEEISARAITEGLCEVERIYQHCKGLQYKLWGSPGLNVLNRLMELCNRNFIAYSLKIIPDLEDIRALREQLGIYLVDIDKDVAFVENYFFNDNYLLEERKFEERANMYLRLLACKDEIKLPLELVRKILLAISSSRDITEIGEDKLPHILGRFLFGNIISTSSRNWEPEECQLLSEIIKFFDNGFNFPGGDPNREKYSHYTKLSPGLKFLRALYLRSHGDSQSPEAQFPSDPSVYILPNLEGLRSPEVCGEYAGDIYLLQALNELGPEIKGKILSSNGNNRLLWIDKYLKLEILSIIPQQKREKLFNIPAIRVTLGYYLDICKKLCQILDRSVLDRRIKFLISFASIEFPLVIPSRILEYFSPGFRDVFVCFNRLDFLDFLITEQISNFGKLELSVYPLAENKLEALKLLKEVGAFKGIIITTFLSLFHILSSFPTENRLEALKLLKEINCLKPEIIANVSVLNAVLKLFPKVNRLDVLKLLNELDALNKKVISEDGGSLIKTLRRFPEEDKQKASLLLACPEVKRHLLRLKCLENISKNQPLPSDKDIPADDKTIKAANFLKQVIEILNSLAKEMGRTKTEINCSFVDQICDGHSTSSQSCIANIVLGRKIGVFDGCAENSLFYKLESAMSQDEDLFAMFIEAILKGKVFKKDEIALTFYGTPVRDQWPFGAKVGEEWALWILKFISMNRKSQGLWSLPCFEPRFGFGKSDESGSYQHLPKFDIGTKIEPGAAACSDCSIYNM